MWRHAAFLSLVVFIGCGSGGGTSTVTPPANYSVAGHVYYSGTTIPVSGVTIEIGESQFTTSEDGRFELGSVGEGNQVVIASKQGYDSYRSSLAVSSSLVFDIFMTSQQFTSIISGSIQTPPPNSSPVSGARVTILNPDGSNSSLSSQTDGIGYYQVPAVPQGLRTIVVEKPLYGIVAADIFVSNSNYSYSQYLSPLSNIELPDIINTDMTLIAFNSPYIVGPEGTTIAPGAVVSVEAGVEIIGSENLGTSRITVAKGAFLVMTGEEEYPVQLRDVGIKIHGAADLYHFHMLRQGINIGAWPSAQGQTDAVSISDGIIIENDYSGLILNRGWDDPDWEISRITVRGCGTGLVVRGFTHTGTVVRIDNSEFSECTDGVTLEMFDSYGDIVLDQCKIVSNTANGVRVRSVAGANSSVSTLHLNSCIVSDNGDNGIYLEERKSFDCNLVDVNLERNGHYAISTENVRGGYIISLGNCNVVDNALGAVRLWRRRTISGWPIAELDAENNWWGVAPPDPGQFILECSNEYGPDCLGPVEDHTPWSESRNLNGADQLDYP